MSYEIRYKESRKALVDMVQYVGWKRYKKLVKFANHPKQRFAAIRFVCSFAGVQGYPVNEFIKRYHPRVMAKPRKW